MSIDQAERPHDYTDITELPGAGATRDQRARLLNRYQTASQYARSKRVLEIACGAGLGLGYLRRSAQRVAGGDYTSGLLRMAQSHYAGRVPLFQLDAHALPFRPASFDLVLIFEALYYMQDAARALSEARRVLDQGGTLLISTVNKDWSGFSPSRFSTRYFSIPELRQMLRQAGFQDPEFFGAFASAPASPVGSTIALMRRAAAALNLVPTTLAGRAALKRIFYGPLAPLPPEVDDTMAPAERLVPLPPDSPTGGFKIIYAAARVA